MVKLVKIVDNKYVQIEEYKNPNICFNTNEYSDFEDYCTLRETFDPFEIFYENQELKSQLKGTTHCFDEEEHEKYRFFKLNNKTYDGKIILKLLDKKETQQKEFIKYLEDMLDNENDMFSVVRVKDVLQKYIEIVNETEQK